MTSAVTIQYKSQSPRHNNTIYNTKGISAVYTQYMQIHKHWVCGSILRFPCQNMFRMFCKSCFVQLRHFRSVGQFLTHDASVLVANALVSSQLYYCNSLFRSLSKFNMHILQCIQNSAARIVSNTNRYTSVYPVLKKLHWHAVEHCTVLKHTLV